MNRLHFCALAFDPTAIDAITRVIIPVSTFVFGIIFTLVLKYYDQKRASFRSKVEEIVELTKSWYNQLHALYVKIEGGASDEVIKTLISDYVNNREIPPNLLLNIEILKKHQRSNRLVTEAKAFLKAVTTFEDEGAGPPGCPPPPTDSGGKVDMIGFRRKLENLDYRLNRVVTEAAKLL